MTRLTSQWLIPSTSDPGVYYTVYLYDDEQTRCNCSWGQKANAPSKCWHVRFALAMDSEATLELLGELDVAAARDGDVLRQVHILEVLGRQLYRNGALRAASRCYEVIQKYMTAISTQGAVVFDPEAAPVAASVAPYKVA